MTLDEATTMRGIYFTALQQVASGLKSYTINFPDGGSRSVTNQDLEFLEKGFAKYDNLVNQLSKHGRRGLPRKFGLPAW